MNLRKHVLEVLSTEWTTTDELADILRVKFPDEIRFEKDYGGDKKRLSQALGPTCWGLRNVGLIEDDGTKWPGTKRWRRIAKEEQTSLDVVINSLIELDLAANENQALRILGMRAIQEFPADYEKIVEEATKIRETKRRLAKIAIGSKKKTGQ